MLAARTHYAYGLYTDDAIHQADMASCGPGGAKNAVHVFTAGAEGVYLLESARFKNISGSYFDVLTLGHPRFSDCFHD